MTTPQPQPEIQYVYVQRPPTDVLGVLGWVAGIIAILCLPAWVVPFGIVPAVAFLVALVLTMASRGGGKRSGHSTAALILLGVVFVLNVLAVIAVS